MLESVASTPRRPPPIGLLLAVLGGLTLLVMTLTVAVVLVRGRDAPPPATRAQGDVRQWERIVDTNQGSAAAHTGLGLTLVAAGRSAEAADSFARALALDEASWTAALQLGLLVQDDDAARAEALFEQAARHAPVRSKAAAFVALGELRLAAGDLAGARVAFEDAVADGPMLVESRVGLAGVLEGLGDGAGALEHYRQAIRYDPGNDDAAAGIARLEGGSG